MNVGSGDQAYVALHPDKIMLDQPVDMTQYSITEYKLVYAPDLKGLQMRIKLKRKITSEMMTTYFPSILLMMITYATTFFKPFFFEAALSVNLTTMLVMTTIFISKMEGLPTTSDTKMIDYWLILCQLVPFAQVVLLTAMEYLREEEQEDGQPLENEELESIKLEKDHEDVESKPRKAWTMPSIKDSSKNPVAILTIIGEILTRKD